MSFLGWRNSDSMRLGVVGSRNFDDNLYAWAQFKNKLNLTLQYYEEGNLTPVEEIVSGGCPVGVDRWAQEYCVEKEIKLKEFLPNLEKFGSPSAFHIRNDDIIDYADEICVFWNGSKVRSGSHSVILKARRRKKKLIVFIIRNRKVENINYGENGKVDSRYEMNDDVSLDNVVGSIRDVEAFDWEK